jgi:hypothetical protein
MHCDRCEIELFERDLYEYLDFLVCEICLDMLLSSPMEEDEIDTLIEDLGNMNTD